MSDHRSLAGRWVFLITMSAILLAIILLTSIVQRRQRTLLSLRIARGEVDLEALGIKCLNVPRDLIDKLPRYTYTSKTGAPVTLGKAATRQVVFSQPTCPICLDDFIHSETTIRELPCNHIFHPECIDSFLRSSSSLCPVCKESALPPGYCPVNVTNLMVRRERLIRRMRHQSQEESTSRIPVAGLTQRPLRILSTPSAPAAMMRDSCVHGYGAYNGDAEMIGTGNRRITHPAIALDHSQNGGVATVTAECRTQPQAEDSNAEEVPAEIQAQGTHARRAWLRERLARRQQQQYDERAQEARQADVGRPLWRRIAGRFNPRWD